MTSMKAQKASHKLETVKKENNITVKWVQNVTKFQCRWHKINLKASKLALQFWDVLRALGAF